MERQLVNEYVELFKKAHNVSDKEWDCNSFYIPLKKAIENATDESLIEKTSKLKQWMKEKGI